MLSWISCRFLIYFLILNDIPWGYFLILNDALRIYVPIVTLLSHLDIPSGCPNQMSPNFYTLHVCFYIPDVLCLQFLYFSYKTALDIMTFSKTLFTWNLTLTYAYARDSKCLPDQDQSKATKTFRFKVQLELV